MVKEKRQPMQDGGKQKEVLILEKLGRL